MRTVLVVALLGLAMMAGCTETPASAVDDADNQLPADGADVEIPNAAPVANLTADVLEGAIPLVVNFTINATDAEGDNMTWSLEINGTSLFDGTEFPAEVNYTFDTAGLWNVSLVLSDGKNATRTLIEINATGEVALAARTPIEVAKYTNTGTISVYALTSSADMARQCPGFNVGQNGRGCVFLVFSKVGAHDGLPAIVTTNAGSVRIAFWDNCSGTGTGKGFGTGATGVKAIIPAGTGCAVAWSSTTSDVGQERSFTMTVYDWLP